MVHRVQATIDLQALRHNFAVARKHARARHVAAIIKANAYGHGMTEVAQALTDADLFGVTDVLEALALDTVGTGKPVLILQGMMKADDIAAVAEHNFQLVVHTPDQLRILEDTLGKMTLKAPLTLWLKMDSGMGRLGIDPATYATTWRALKGRPWVKDVIMMTHLANSSLPASPLNQQQIKAFRVVEEQLSAEHPVTSIPCSSGLLTSLDTQCEWARPGIMLYGSSPFAWSEASLRREAFDLKAVMTLEARIIAVKQLKAGDNIGYCSQFICPRDMRAGIVSIGYADGYPSNAPNETPVMVDGKRTCTVGRVSMDMLAVDLSEIPEAREGGVATLWGEALSLDEVAAKTGILSYNLTCSIARRVEFSYING
ncbi:MAG: alanine racemase [Pseudohongiellaceae bacterium]